MTLVQLRKLSIKKRCQIHFRLRNGMECVITEQGVAQVPQLRALPDFNIDEELAAAGEFLIEPVQPAAGKSPSKNGEQPRKVSRQELAAMAAPSTAGAAPVEHDDE
jgi:hypothetical protein